ncbi:MAG: hypothetical protein ACPLRZ_01370 [Thermovenabulum sp.]|uniref:hypothetical protein n=1 Tax=Thermovenabulum sp. TaxID=3100335 RepID=UPI003C7CF59C
MEGKINNKIISHFNYFSKRELWVGETACRKELGIYICYKGENELFPASILPSTKKDDKM